MHDVKVTIIDKDRKVGAMVKALAVEISGFEAVSGTTKAFLQDHGFYVFHFPHANKAEDFKQAVGRYIPSSLAQVAQ